MLEKRQIATGAGLTFDAWMEGPLDGPLVLLLHGFPQSRHAWTRQVAALAAAGYRAVAPDQRGYSPGARPDAGERANYAIDRLVGDAFEIAAAAGHPHDRFHLVGIDWGGQVAWCAAAAHPERLASLSVLSRPHPSAFLAALEGDAFQKGRSAHHSGFFDPATTGLLLADGAQRIRTLLEGGNVPAEGIENYLSVLGDPAAMEAAVGWYRGGGLRVALPPITVPTLYVWGDADSSVGRMAAEGTAAHVTAEFRFEELAGIGHFSTDQVPDRINTLLLDHIGRHPA